MSTYKNLISLGAAAVFALGLAACSSSSSGPPPNQDLVGMYVPSGTLTISLDDATDTTISAAKDETVDIPGLGSVQCVSDGGCTGTVSGGTLTITGDIKIVSVGAGLDSASAAAVRKVAVAKLPTTPAPTPLSHATALNTSVKAMNTLAGAATAEGSALKMAADASAKLGVLATGGDSSMATMNAQAILDAQEALTNAVADATAKKADAEAAKTKTSDPDVTAALDQAITAATTAITAAQAVLDDKTASTSLIAYVQMVTGTDKDDVKTAADKGREVADAISDAFTNETPRIPALVSSGAPTTATDTATKAVTMNDSEGMTWAEIVGAANIKMERLGQDNAAVPVSSIAGMTASDVNAALTATGGTGGTNKYADATSQADSSYKGIPGIAYCLGKDCEVASDGKLKGSWYFTPTSATAPYIPHATTAGTYTAESLYVTYGHWLSSSGDPVVYAVNRFATLTGGSGELDLAYPSQQDSTRAAEASYSGKAAGMSVLRTYDGKNKVTGVDSGSFTADVNLTAKFGGAPTIGGTISNFAGSAVDTDWSVTLDPQTLSTTAETDGVAKGGGANGTWSAQAYGEANKRPKGVFGGFNANFTNGNAAGAYATRMQ